MEYIDNLNITLGFVTCVSDVGTLSKRLLASNCLQSNEHYQAIHFNTSSAAAAFNFELDMQVNIDWMVWIHQDVFLPGGWDKLFISKITEAIKRFPKLSVVGVYGVYGAGAEAIRAGNILDRGVPLKETAPLPCCVNSLDELLIAVRTDSGLRFDPNLGFDFYATDIALTAQQNGLNVAVVDAYCEHWSSTPSDNVSACVASRVLASGEVFERKWLHHFPLDTPCFSIENVGDVAIQCKKLTANSQAK